VPCLFGEAEQHRHIARVTFQRPDHNAPHQGFGFGNLFDFSSVPERNFLVQDPIEEGLEVLTSFGAAAWVAGLTWLEPAMLRRAPVANLRWRPGGLLCIVVDIGDGHPHRYPVVSANHGSSRRILPDSHSV